MIAAIVDELAPELIKRNAIGYESASQLLITAGDNPQRLRSESGFAALCGVSRSPFLLEKRTVTDLIVVEIVHFTSSPSDAYELTQNKGICRRACSRRTYKNGSDTLSKAIYLPRSLHVTAQSKQADQQYPDNSLTLRRASVSWQHHLILDCY